jgi:Cytochrome C and Quinol oxidase polypeptide I
MTPEAAASATPGTAAAVSPVVSEAPGLVGWVVTRDHKRIGILILATGFAMFLFDGVLGLTMRAQLAQPGQRILSPQQYNQFVTMHGTGMIAVTITPFALGLGVYLIPLQVGAPRIAAPRLTLLGYWLYVAGAVTLIWAFLVPDGAAAGWWGTPRYRTASTPRARGRACGSRGCSWPRHGHDNDTSLAAYNAYLQALSGGDRDSCGG